MCNFFSFKSIGNDMSPWQEPYWNFFIAHTSDPRSRCPFGFFCLPQWMFSAHNQNIRSCALVALVQGLDLIEREDFQWWLGQSLLSGTLQPTVRDWDIFHLDWKPGPGQEEGHQMATCWLWQHLANCYCLKLAETKLPEIGDYFIKNLISTLHAIK